MKNPKIEVMKLIERSGAEAKVTYPYHFESSAEVPAPPAALFAEIDDPSRLGEHMTTSSFMMAGSKMTYSYDEAGGKAVGSKIRMSGSMLGFDLGLEEIVTERVPPFRKVWETIGDPRLLVIGSYRMGFEITPLVGGSRLKLFIDWREPSAPWRWLSRLLGPAYARWCTESMAKGVAASLAHRPTSQAKVAA